MSLLLRRRISKLWSSFGELRFLSTAARPYLLLRNESLALNLLDPCKQETVQIPKPSLSEELRRSVRFGSSKGWVALANFDDLKLHLSNLYNPFASEKFVISLPPLEKIYKGSIARVWSVSLSSSPDKEDCVVAAKLNAPFISLCRPGDSEWTHIETPMTFLTSEVMYSVRDRRFYLLSSYTAPIGLIKTCSDFPPVSPYQRFPFSDIPKSTEDLIQSTVSRSQYLVEAPTGDSFIVFWCNEGLKKETSRSRPRCETKAFMVFRQDREQGIGSYTQDIGDLSIFLGDNEAFCVSATEHPGLKPNSVYFASYETGFGYYDLMSNTVHDLTHLASSNACLWLAPLY